MSAGWIAAGFVYLYAGWTMAEVAAVAPMKLERARKFVYCALLLLWPVFMPWVPRHIESSRKRQGANGK